MHEYTQMAILRLTQDLSWIEEVLGARKGIRGVSGITLRKSGTPLTTMDKVLHTKINEYILDADQQYSTQQFKNALKSCFYEMGNAKNQYINYHKLANLSMHEDVLMRYINAYTIMLSPICSHWCEYVWMDVLGNETSVTKALWPTTVEMDIVIMQIQKYVMDTIDSFRKSLAPPKKKKKKKKKGNADEEKPYVKPTQAYVYVGLTYAPWRIELLELLTLIYNNNNQSFPKTSIKELMPMVQKSEQLKAEGKTLLKVAAFIINEVKTVGPNALLPKLPFNEIDILNENKQYIEKSLELKNGFEIFLNTAADADIKRVDGMKSDLIESALPGKPTIAGFA
jgi:leucyl-tRNA synthetase